MHEPQDWEGNAREISVAKRSEAAFEIGLERFEGKILGQPAAV